jgi:hypothetical protein
MEFWLSRSLSHEFFFFTMEFWLSRSLPHELFFFMMEFWLSRSLSHELFIFTMEFWLSRSLLDELFFSRWNSGYQEAFHTIKFTKCKIQGKTLFIYITKSIYTGPASLKTLPLDLEPPLQGKEYGPPYCNEIAEKKENVFVPEITYRFLTWILFF